MAACAGWKRALIALALISMSSPAVIAGGAGAAPTDPASAPAASGATASDAMSIEDIQDVAFTLRRIHQEAVDIFVEATRKKTKTLDLKLATISSIPETTFADSKSYLPLRKGWLAFFIGTIESLVSILNEELRHLDEIAKREAIPADKMPEWNVLVEDWKKAVSGLNHELDVCARVVDEPAAENVEVAKAAQAIDRQVGVLKDILLRADKLDQEINHQK